MRRRNGCLIAGGVLLLLAVVPGVAFLGFVSLRQGSVSNGESPTLEDLDTVAARLWPAKQEPPTVEELGAIVAGHMNWPPEDAHEAVVSPKAGDEDAAQPSPPTRLAGRPSREVLAERYQRKDTNGGAKVAEARLIGGVARVFGPDGATEGLTWEAGRRLMWAGEWDAARGYLYEVVLGATGSSTAYRDACGWLAWLEDDPEKAARLLDMSANDRATRDHVARGSLVARSPGHELDSALAKAELADLEKRLGNAVELAHVTGSDALAEYYMAKLRALSPVAARELEAMIEAQEKLGRMLSDSERLEFQRTFGGTGSGPGPGAATWTPND